MKERGQGDAWGIGTSEVLGTFVARSRVLYRISSQGVAGASWVGGLRIYLYT